MNFEEQLQAEIGATDGLIAQLETEIVSLTERRTLLRQALAHYSGSVLDAPKPKPAAIAKLAALSEEAVPVAKDAIVLVDAQTLAPVTQKQAYALAAIQRVLARKDHPSMFEIAREMGYDNTGNADWLLKALAQRGYVRNVGVPGAPDWILLAQGEARIEPARARHWSLDEITDLKALTVVAGDSYDAFGAEHSRTANSVAQKARQLGCYQRELEFGPSTGEGAIEPAGEERASAEETVEEDVSEVEANPPTLPSPQTQRAAVKPADAPVAAATRKAIPLPDGYDLSELTRPQRDVLQAQLAAGDGATTAQIIDFCEIDPARVPPVLSSFNSIGCNSHFSGRWKLTDLGFTVASAVRDQERAKA